MRGARRLWYQELEMTPIPEQVVDQIKYDWFFLR